MTNQTIYKKKLLPGELFPPPFLPYSDYQVPIIKKMIETIQDGKNGLIIQPTATGKSVEAAFTARSCILLHQMKGLYLYDENDGLTQARERFEHIFGKNPIKCANFFGLKRDEDVTEADLVFASFQSMNNHHEQWYKMFDQKHFDFVIVNEAHHGSALTYRPVIEHFQCSKIGMTATPERMDGLDILEIFDEVLFDIPLTEAIVKGWVCPIEYHVLGHNLSSKKLKEIAAEHVSDGKKISMRQVNESIFIDELDEEMLKQVYEFSFPEGETPRQTKIFCENIIHADRIVSRIKADGHTVEGAHSGLGPSHNTNSLQKFRDSEIQFFVSVDKYNEDIDIASIEVVVFFRNTDSKRIFFQQLGRGMRKGKPMLYVLDFVGNSERLLMVKKLQDDIQEAFDNESLLDNSVIHLIDINFSFKWHGYSPDALKLIEAIQLGKYKTWQEAKYGTESLSVKLGILLDSFWKYKKYYKNDPRLPCDPNQQYSDFPGLDIFFNKAWLTEEELKQKCLEHFENLDFTGENYDLIRKKIKGPDVNNFPRIYGKTFKEFFKGEKMHKDTVWATEEELKQSALSHFGNFDFTSEKYEEVRSILNGPDYSSFMRIYNKSFRELFTGSKKGIWPTEEELKQSALSHFGNFDFTSEKYEESKKKINGPHLGHFPRIYGKTFQEFFKGSKKGDWLTEEELKQKCLEHFKNFDFSSSSYEKERKIFEGPTIGHFPRIYGKTFQEFFKGARRKKPNSKSD